MRINLDITVAMDCQGEHQDTCAISRCFRKVMWMFSLFFPCGCTDIGADVVNTVESRMVTQAFKYEPVSICTFMLLVLESSSSFIYLFIHFCSSHIIVPFSGQFWALTRRKIMANVRIKLASELHLAKNRLWWCNLNILQIQVCLDSKFEVFF